MERGGVEVFPHFFKMKGQNKMILSNFGNNLFVKWGEDIFFEFNSKKFGLSSFHLRQVKVTHKYAKKLHWNRMLSRILCKYALNKKCFKTRERARFKCLLYFYI